MLAYGAICWSSKKQSAITLSSTEADYRGVVTATTQSLLLQAILREFGIESITSTIIFFDNQSAIQISKFPFHMHYIKELMHDEVIALHYSTSSEQVAETFTN